MSDRLTFQVAVCGVSLAVEGIRHEASGCGESWTELLRCDDRDLLESLPAYRAAARERAGVPLAATPAALVDAWERAYLAWTGRDYL